MNITTNRDLVVANLIGGEFRPPMTGRYLDAIDPATEERIGSVPASGAADVEAATAAAAGALPAWRDIAPGDRRVVLERLAAVLVEHGDELADLESWDTGNTISKARKDVDGAARVVNYFAGLGEQVLGQTIPATTNNLHFTLAEPYGVVARLIPFNHPLAFAAGKLAPPLMAGNTIVIKPSEQAALSMGPFAELCAEVFPAGVVNIVHGDGPGVGEPLVRDPRVRRIAFTGSVAGGLAVSRAAADSGNIKVLTLELGGKNPFVVLPDVDVDEVAAAAVAGMNFAWQGQSCGATSRLIVHGSIVDDVSSAVAKLVGGLRQGLPRTPDNDIGPVVSKSQYDKVMGFIARAEQEGAKVLTGGGRPTGPEFERGYWIQPTVLGGVTPDMSTAKEESFGPVLSILRWDTEDELYEIANGVEYGLTGAVWSKDTAAALRVARKIDTGYLWVNCIGTKFMGIPFGGYKNSGIGRENSLEELTSFVQMKSINLAL